MAEDWGEHPRTMRAGAGVDSDLLSGSSLQQMAARGGRRLGAVCGDKLLPEEFHVEAEEVSVQEQAVRICIHLPDYLQVERQWSGTVQPRGGGGGAGAGTGQEGWSEVGGRGFPRAPVVKNPSGNAGTQVQF